MRKLGTMGSGCAPRAGCLLRTLLAKMLGPLTGWLESIYGNCQGQLLSLTSDPKLVLHEPPRDAFTDADGLPGHVPRRCPSAPLTRAVVDEVGHPSAVLANEGAPEEVPVCAQVPGPLIWEALCDAGQLDRVGPDLAHRQLGPVGDVDGRRHLALRLHYLLFQEELMQEIQGAVGWSWQEDQLQEKREVAMVLYLPSSPPGRSRGILSSGSAG